MKTIEEESVKSILGELALDISLAKFSRRYFERSSSWIYNKLNEVDGNGGKGGFTKEEKEKLKESLYHLSKRIEDCSNKL